MSALWSAQQHEWLQAMGYRVWRLAGDEPAPAEPAAHEAVPPGTRPPEPRRPEIAPPEARKVIAPEPPTATTPTRPSPTGAARRLHRALLRAAGQRTTRAAEALLAPLQVDLDALRDDPAAKRALWARVRALRKTSQR